MRSLGLAVSAVLLIAGVAYGNGRAPLTNGIYFKPGDAHSLYVRTTFGLLISHDDGCTFWWICDDNMGFGGTYDPEYRVSSSGAIFTTTYHGLRRSADDGCSFSTVTGDELVESIDIGPTGEVWIATSTTAFSNDVYRSTDDGLTFKSVGLPTWVARYESVKIAPSDAKRIYVTSSQSTSALGSGVSRRVGDQTDTGEVPPSMHLLRSDDGGITWTLEPLANVIPAPSPEVIVVAVDPTNEDVVYMASVSANQELGDYLYRSDDGGVTFSQVLAVANSIQDVVVVDATHVIVTTSIKPGPAVMTELGGPAYMSTNAGVQFTQITAAPQLDCLGMSPDGTLAGCGANWQPDYMALTKSADLGSSWQEVWRFTNLAGPSACPNGSPEQAMCDIEWTGSGSGLKGQFMPSGPACGANESEAPPKQSGGCCDAGDSAPITALAAVAVALVIARRRRAR